MTAPPPPLRNAHLSFSRISRYETCPLAYKLHYVDRLEPEPGLALRFGKVLHTVLEHLLRHVIDDEYVGPLSEARALELFQHAWNAEGLAGVELFEEGVRILRDFVRAEGIVDHRHILAVEKEFQLPVGPFTLLGYIDRVDWVDGDTIEIIDYKSNHQIFARDDIASSLQLSLYAAAARVLWPWAKNIRLSFHLLRHDIKQETTRTPEQLAAALAYVEAIGVQMETSTEFPARLQPNCVHCDHRAACPAYADALRGHREFICKDPSDLESVAREREEVARLAKFAYARKEELDRVLRAHLEDKDEILLAGVRYRIFRTTSFDYPLEPTVALLGEATGIPHGELRAELATVDKKALDAILKRLGKRLGRPRIALLKTELEAHAKTHHSPRLWAKELE